MRKIISCKVIKSIPLHNSSDELHFKNRIKNKSHKISDSSRTPNTKKCLWEPEASSNNNHSRQSVTYTHRLDIIRTSIDNGFTTKRLDFYI
ncbi:MAG: hypothetical protein PVJ60_09615 [Phycisphaerales bacterium]|jgi:hypothetical protein